MKVLKIGESDKIEKLVINDVSKLNKHRRSYSYIKIILQYSVHYYTTSIIHL